MSNTSPDAGVDPAGEPPADHVLLGSAPAAGRNRALRRKSASPARQEDADDLVAADDGEAAGRVFAATPWLRRAARRRSHQPSAKCVAAA